MASSVPGFMGRPAMTWTFGRKLWKLSGTPRSVTLVTPTAPIFSMAATTTSSGAPIGFPFSSLATPGAVRMVSASDLSRMLASSASLPRRTTTATFGSPAAESVFLIPAESMRAEASTKTTSAMPSAVAMVVAFLTARLRTLYLSGTIGPPRRRAGRRRPP